MGKTQKYDHMKLIRQYAGGHSALIAAFRVQANMRTSLMRRIITLPLGVFDEDGTGKIRRIVNDSTAIQEALSRLIKDKTVLIIAHRMRTIANADHIVVLKDGVVAEQGSPEFLSGYDSIYSRMTKQQLISQNWKM